MDRFKANFMVFLLGMAVFAGIGFSYEKIHTCDWDVHPNCWAKDRMVEVPGPERVIYQNDTVYVKVTETAQPSLPPYEAPNPVSQPKPIRYETVWEQPKYEIDRDYTAIATISTTPEGGTPWTGNGMPWIIIEYYRSGYGTFLNDTKILHNGWAFNYGYSGFDVCGYSHIYRFWSFIATYAGAVPPATDPILRYTSSPLSNNPHDYLGNGEKCFASVHAISYWAWGACLEGDGSLSKVYYEDHEHEHEIVNHTHADKMDACGYGVIRFPAGEQSTETALVMRADQDECYYDGREPASDFCAMK